MAQREEEYKRLELFYQMLVHYLDRPYSDAELGDLLETDRTNVWRIRKIIKALEIPLEESFEHASKYSIRKDFQMRYIHFSPEEMAALYLAARRLQQQTKTNQEHVGLALRKLANALRKPFAESLIKAAGTVQDQEQDVQQQQVFSLLVKSWLDKSPVRIFHRVLHGERRDYIVHPYHIEPSMWGDGNYLFGYSEYHKKIARFKIARIEKVVQTGGPYREYDEFDVQTFLKHAWGIWSTDEEPVTVRLRFNKWAIPRLTESVWPQAVLHPPAEDGSQVWEMPVAEWREMAPWVRGWGRGVQVIEPVELHDHIRRHLIAQMDTYDIVRAKSLPYQLLYAKTKEGSEEIHLLLYHLIDVGQVALAMWQLVLTDSIRQRMAKILNLNVDQAGRFVAFIAALHDLGKAFPGYQKKYGPPWLQEAQKQAGLGLDGIIGKSYQTQTPHGTVSTWALMMLLPAAIGIDETFANQIAVAIGGHHGSWPGPGETERLDDCKFPRWDEVRRDLLWEVQAVFRPPTNVALPADKGARNTFLTLVSGLVSVADWVGSRNEECFGFAGEPMSTRQYTARSAQNAHKSLQDLGWLGWQPDGQTRAFAETFAYLKFNEPRGVQAQVIAAAHGLKPPTLLIVEAPTGIGKTEIALFLADTWLQQHAGRGIYVAMPTQATSNQMYGRIGEYLHYRYPDMKLNYHLVHGQAGWQDELKAKVELQGVGDDDAAGIRAESWFTPRKRTLLAPFGVGTVDQTLMSILQTHHFFVRLFGLSHKVVIFDEVHAYDTFMSTLFHRLLQWLNAIGTSVIILSATLPKETRRQLVEAYSGQDLTDTSDAYPALTIATPDCTPSVIALPKPDDVTLRISWDAGREPTEILDYLQTNLADGGCAAVICNTVGRAQAIFGVLEDARQKGDLDLSEDDLLLFHARFPPVWRQAIEDKVLRKFGKPDAENAAARPTKAIVVATQVIEQSLDLDFDLMITDLAPIDLVIQRAGRLHRHERDGERRYGHTRRLVITEPLKDANGVPDFGSDEWVYEPYILLRSYLALHGKDLIAIPGDTIALIEAVYDDSPDENSLPSTWQAALQSTRKAMDDNRREAISKAERQLVMKPENSRLLKQRNANLDEESPDVHETFRAQTRDIDPGIALVCLHREGEHLVIHTPDGKQVIDIEAAPSRNLVKLLQQNTITVQHKAMMYHFIDQQPPASWQKEAALRHCRPVIFEHGHYEHPTLKYRLHLTQKLGLEIIKKEEA